MLYEVNMYLHECILSLLPLVEFRECIFVISFSLKYLIAISELRSIRNETGLNSDITKITSVSRKKKYSDDKVLSFAKTTKIIQKPCDFGSFLWHGQMGLFFIRNIHFNKPTSIPHSKNQ